MGQTRPAWRSIRRFMILASAMALLMPFSFMIQVGSPETVESTSTEDLREIPDRKNYDIGIRSVYFEKAIPSYGEFGCFKVGLNTVFWVGVKNYGLLGSQSENFTASLKITDSNGGEVLKTEQEYPVPSFEEVNLTFSWSPIYSGSFKINVTLYMEGDEDQGNDFYESDGLWALKWSEDSQDGELNGWEGDISPKEWHITDTVFNDPAPANHTSTKVLYHGEESDWDHYGINEKISIISPSIDLTRFNSSAVNCLLFSYYGNAASGDILSIYFKTQEDTSFYKTLELPQLHEYFNSSNDWVRARFPSEPELPGIRIEDKYIGHIIQIMVEWDSDLILENETGYYLDDLAVVGEESPPFNFDIGVGMLSLSYASTVWDYGAVDVGVDITTEIFNYGTETAHNVSVTISAQDSTKRVVNINGPSGVRIDSLQAGESSPLKVWSFIPSVSGVYTVSVLAEFGPDQFQSNNMRESSVQVAKYLCDVEDDDRHDKWSAQGPWHREWVKFDPDVNDHSAPNAWTFSSSNGSYPANLNASLYTPVIDLMGVNYLHEDRAILASFKWYGETSIGDKLLFEYTTDGGETWSLVDSTTGAESVIFGKHTSSWHVNETWGSVDLVGEKVQFRLRVTSDDHFDHGKVGFFIDDFIVLALEEEYGRPQVQAGHASPEIILNDNHTEALLSIGVTDIEGDLDRVTIDLSQLGGAPDSMMSDNGTGPDDIPLDGTFSTMITAATDTPPGTYRLMVTAIDDSKRIGVGEIPIEIWENEPPWFVSVFPESSDVTINENESITFLAYAEDAYHNTSITYTWTINGIVYSQGPESQLYFNTTYLGNLSAGAYNISVKVEDKGHPPLSAYRNWSIHVLDILPDLAITPMDVRISDPSPSEGGRVQIFIEISNLGVAEVRNFQVEVWQDSEQPELKKIIGSRMFEVLKGNDTLSFSLTWVATTNTKWIAVWLDPEDVISELNESNNIAWKNITVMAMPVVVDEDDDEDIFPTEEPDGDTIDTDNVIGWTTLAVVVVVVSIGLFSFVAIGTEYGLYRLLALGIPLYSRITGKKVLRHSLRDRIYNHIRTNPGDHYRSIMLTLKLKNGTLVHHLTRLEQEELIRSEMDGLYKRFYPSDMKVPFSEVGQFYPDGTKTFNIGNHQLSEQQMEIYRVIKRNPGCSQKKIGIQLNESRRVINYHVKLLDASGLIRVEKEGRRTKCYVEEIPLDVAK